MKPRLPPDTKGMPRYDISTKRSRTIVGSARTAGVVGKALMEKNYRLSRPLNVTQTITLPITKTQTVNQTVRPRFVDARPFSLTDNIGSLIYRDETSDTRIFKPKTSLSRMPIHHSGRISRTKPSSRERLKKLELPPPIRKIHHGETIKAKREKHLLLSDKITKDHHPIHSRKMGDWDKLEKTITPYHLCSTTTTKREKHLLLSDKITKDHHPIHSRKMGDWDKLEKTITPYHLCSTTTSVSSHKAPLLVTTSEKASEPISTVKEYNHDVEIMQGNEESIRKERTKHHIITQKGTLDRTQRISSIVDETARRRPIPGATANQKVTFSLCAPVREKVVRRDHIMHKEPTVVASLLKPSATSALHGDSHLRNRASNPINFREEDIKRRESRSAARIHRIQQREAHLHDVIKADAAEKEAKTTFKSRIHSEDHSFKASKHVIYDDSLDRMLVTFSQDDIRGHTVFLDSSISSILSSSHLFPLFLSQTSQEIVFVDKERYIEYFISSIESNIDKDRESVLKQGQTLTATSERIFDVSSIELNQRGDSLRSQSGLSYSSMQTHQQPRLPTDPVELLNLKIKVLNRLKRIIPHHVRSSSCPFLQIIDLCGICDEAEIIAQTLALCDDIHVYRGAIYLCLPMGISFSDKVSHWRKALPSKVKRYANNCVLISHNFPLVQIEDAIKHSHPGGLSIDDLFSIPPIRWRSPKQIEEDEEREREKQQYQKELQAKDYDDSEHSEDWAYDDHFHYGEFQTGKRPSPEVASIMDRVGIHPDGTVVTGSKSSSSYQGGKLSGKESGVSESVIPGIDDRYRRMNATFLLSNPHSVKRARSAIRRRKKEHQEKISTRQQMHELTKEFTTDSLMDAEEAMTMIDEERAKQEGGKRRTSVAASPYWRDEEKVLEFIDESGRKRTTNTLDDLLGDKHEAVSLFFHLTDCLAQDSIQISQVEENVLLISSK
ncbi:hypothetical protein ADUPG1_008309 [Aduncisulcus paluster]|uniref:Uncharacterized protein n=1 Tax=Aduncisulcus paluster TaxID=2918883 RepID=A0ABQ5KRI0_9EUKA|nr:hypothetical protein ADUPG1_008309 [Aduncisulcus paluster]